MSFLRDCKSGTTPLGAYLAFESLLSVHLMASAGFNWLLVDMEHSPLSARETTAIVHAIANGSHGQCSSLVRIPATSVEWVKWALDSGAGGVVAPMIQSKEEAERLVRYAKYPPVGQRSFGPFNAPWADVSSDRSLAKYVDEAMKPDSGRVAVIAMIESEGGVKNAEAIISTKGIDGIFIGPVDLRLSLGLAGADGIEQAYVDALNSIVRLCKQHGKVVGVFSAGPEILKKHISMGFDYLLVAGDSTSLSNGAQMALKGSQEAAKQAKL